MLMRMSNDVAEARPSSTTKHRAYYMKYQGRLQGYCMEGMHRFTGFMERFSRNVA